MNGPFRGGADETLRNVFWDLGQIGGADGPKYPESLRRRLAAKILDGRAHEILVFRLCHLVRCAAFAGGARAGWLEFFCDPGAGRASWAAGWLRARLPPYRDEGADAPPACAARDGAILRYPGRDAPVSIAYGAMPLLAVFMEFLLNALGYRAARDAALPLSRPGLSWRELQDTANALSRTAYAWLRAHTRPVQESRDFDAIARFLAARVAGGDISPDNIDDAAVLAFWLAASVAPGSEFRTFRKTFRAFLRFADALREAALREGLDNPDGLEAPGRTEHADPASPRPGASESAAADAWAFGANDDEPAPLETVAGSDIKLLLAGEARRLAPVDAHPRLLPRLALSLLRDARFGQAQGRLSQALRMGAAPAFEPDVGYDAEAAAFGKLLAHLDGLVAAAAVVLVGGEHGGGRLPGLVAARGRRALKSLRRRGFDALRAGAPEAVAELRQASPAIVALRDRLAPLYAALRAGAPWTARQDEDDETFRKQFARIYGAAGVQEGTTP